MTNILRLIQENKKEEIIQNYSKSKFRIYELLVDVFKEDLLEDDKEFNFEADKYQQEFIEGVKIFKALIEADLQMDAMIFSTVLVYLGFKTGEFIHLLSETAMNKGVYLSEISVFKIEPELRNSMQQFYDCMDDNYLVPKANIAASKTRISQAIYNKISKSEFGNDMLQMGISYEKINENQMAANIYQGVINDFESESAKLSSGLFPEISQVDDRNEDDIIVYNKAIKLFENLTKSVIPQPERIHIDKSQLAKKLVEDTNVKAEKIDNSKNSGFFSKIKKWLS